MGFFISASCHTECHGHFTVTKTVAFSFLMLHIAAANLGNVLVGAVFSAVDVVDIGWGHVVVVAFNDVVIFVSLEYASLWMLFSSKQCLMLSLAKLLLLFSSRSFPPSSSAANLWKLSYALRLPFSCCCKQLLWLTCKSWIWKLWQDLNASIEALNEYAPWQFFIKDALTTSN